MMFWRTVNAILCQDCLKHRTTAILNRLFGNGELTCTRCGCKVKDN